MKVALFNQLRTALLNSDINGNLKQTDRGYLTIELFDLNNGKEVEGIAKTVGIHEDDFTIAHEGYTEKYEYSERF